MYDVQNNRYIVYVDNGTINSCRQRKLVTDVYSRESSCIRFVYDLYY